MHEDFANFAKEMSAVRGAIVVMREDLIQGSENIAPAKTLDYAETLRSYFPIFKSSFLPMYEGYKQTRLVSRCPPLLIRWAATLSNLFRPTVLLEALGSKHT